LVISDDFMSRLHNQLDSSLTAGHSSHFHILSTCTQW